MKKTLPKELTAYDLAKTFAVIFMIIDHTGFYFFPDDNWWRVAGRLCVPVWFFLIGYAKSRDLGPHMWIGAGILICSDLAAGLYLFPVNILATMIIVRLTLDRIMDRALRGKHQFWAVNVILFFLVIPSSYAFEYGTLGFILAIFGYLIRHNEEIKELPFSKDLVSMYFAFAAATFIVLQSLMFGFTGPQAQALGAGIIAVMGALAAFRPVTFPKASAVIPRPFTWLLQLTGRRTLEIYVAHLLLFKAIGLLTQPERFAFMDWEIFYTGEPV